MKKTITRQDLKDILEQDEKRLIENVRLVKYLNNSLYYEKAVHKREEIEENLASLEKVGEGLENEIQGIIELLSLNVIDITIIEGEDVQDVSTPPPIGRNLCSMWRVR